MAPPIYFLPDTTHVQYRPGGGKIAEGFLAARRLDKVLADVPLGRFLASDLHKKGPGDQHGMLLQAQPAGGGVCDRFDYLPEKQDWHRVIDPEDQTKALYWIGIDKAAPPKPSDLQRMKLVDGYLVKLLDGQFWKAPLIRQPTETGLPATKLPCRVEYGWDGSSRQIVKDEYLDLWDKSSRCFDLVCVGVQPEDGDGMLLRLFALECLALNYRLGPAEVNQLGILDNETVAEIVKVGVGVNFLEELAQKKSDPPAE